MKKSFELRISNSVFMAISLFALVKPDSLVYLGLGWLDTFLIVFDIVLMLFLLLNLGSYKISKQSAWVALIYIVLTVSTILHQGNYGFLIKTVGPAIAAVMYTDYCMQKCPMKFIKVNLFLWGTLYTLNFISILIFPNGMYTTDRLRGDCWLMGFDNGYTLVLIPLAGFAMMYTYFTREKLIAVESIYILALIVVTELFTWSASGLVMTVALLVLVLMGSAGNIKKMLNPHLLVGIFYIVTIMIVFFRILNVFEPIIVGVLKKDLTLTGRTYLWDYAIGVFKENWFIGIGQSGYSVVGKYNTYLHPHCMILDFLYKGGICMLLPFIVVMHRFCRFLSKKNTVSIIILIVTVCLLTGEIANSSQYKPYFWIYVVMAAYAERLNTIANQNEADKSLMEMQK